MGEVLFAATPFSWEYKMSSNSLFTRLKQFDAYSKTLEDFKVKTFSGATSEKSHNNITLSNVYIIYTQ